MQSLLYIDLTRKRASESLSGGSFKFPTLAFGEDATISLRLAERIGGELSEIFREVVSLRASIGKIDARPESGKVAILIGEDTPVEGTNLTTPLAWNAKPHEVEAALNALTIVGTTYGAASVEEKGGSWLVTFEDEVAPVPISVGSNSLFPSSFLRVRSASVNGQYIHDLRLIQAPVASTATFARVAPPAPFVTTIVDGGEESGFSWPEAQSLFIPPGFRGTYQVRRGFKTTGLLDRSDGAEDLARALNENLTDADDEIFTVTLPTDNTFVIEFGGALKGINHDPLEVEVFAAPDGDITFTLPLDSAELAALLWKAEKVTLPIEIEAVIEDPNDSEVTYTRKLLRDTVTIERSLQWEGLEAVASVDWTRPPLPKDYRPFSPGQISNGQIHYSVTRGNAVDTSFDITHNLGTDRVDVIIHENAASGAPLEYGVDFTYTRTNSNALVVTFTDPPALNSKLITILGLEMTSFFDDHDHEIPEVVGLSAILDDLGSRLEAIEARTGLGALPASPRDDTGEAARWTLPTLFEIFPSRQKIEDPGASLAALEKSLLPRARGLFPAIHSATVGTFTEAPDAATTEDAGTVLENTSGGDIILPVGFGQSTARIKDGGLIASDGRAWYPVTKYGAEDPVTVSVGSAPSTTLSSPGHFLANAVRGRLTTTGTLPAPLATGTDYFVIDSDPYAGTISLASTEGGEAITLTTTGTGVHTFTKRAESSFYPTQFERELFTVHINERQLRTGKTLKLNFALEAALYGANTSAQWSLILELGEAEAATTPALTGMNLSRLKWRGTPILEQRLIISPVTALHRFGVTVDRYSVEGADRFRVTPLLYGASGSLAAPPSSANFAIRGKLARFDTEDGESNPSGFVALKGLTFESLQDGKHGFAFIE